MNQHSTTINRGYMYTQLDRALSALNIGESSDSRVQKWLGVIMGTASGTISVGSRTPVADAPAWVTLEVVTGGFATGRFMAQTELDEADLEILTHAPDASVARQRVNLWFLSDEGQRTLVEASESGAYRIDVPEHGALMAVALLNRDGHVKAALKLIRTIGPWMDRLKFSPILTNAPMLSGALVHVTDAQEIRYGLMQKSKERSGMGRVQAMNTTIRIWLPLYDRVAELWTLHVEGQTQGWEELAAQWLADNALARKKHKMPSRFASKHAPYTVLSEAVSKRLKMSKGGVFRADVNALAVSALSRYVAKYGEPTGARVRALREIQNQVAALPVRSAIAQMVAARLANVPARQGLASLTPYIMPAQRGEHPEVFEGTPVPDGLQQKLRRALDAPLEDHLASGVIGSGEVLADVLPQLTASIAAAHYKDEAARRLYTHVYAAFKSRRSLLLLDLQSQVGITELPWVSSLNVWKVKSISATAQAQGALREVVMAYMDTFAHTLMPNPFVSELQSLSHVAGVEVPLMEELAADIFMGRFTPKWTVAARQASVMLQGTLYARYYDLPEEVEYDHVNFAKMCQARASANQHGQGSPVARNGTVIEQSQILTTHNLAQLTLALGLKDTLSAMAPKIVDAVFEWVLCELATQRDGYINRLRATKNIAYGWRQLVFVMSLLDRSAQFEAFFRMRTAFDARVFKDPCVQVLEPALHGLNAVLHGESFPENGRMFFGGSICKRMLGWSVGTHWMLA